MLAPTALNRFFAACGKFEQDFIHLSFAILAWLLILMSLDAWAGYSALAAQAGHVLGTKHSLNASAARRSPRPEPIEPRPAGTVPLISQTDNEPQLDAVKSITWSTGVVLFALATGVLATEGIIRFGAQRHRRNRRLTL